MHAWLIRTRDCRLFVVYAATRADAARQGRVLRAATSTEVADDRLGWA